MLVGALLLASLGSSPGYAQVNMEAYRDYFLVGRFGEVCTMCEVTVRCQVADAAAPPVPPAMASPTVVVPEQGRFVVYHIQTRTFWSQISTIWEWFVANFSSASLAARGHTRPVHVYQVSDGQWAPRQVVEARLILDPGVIELGDRRIDRVTRRWQRAGDGADVGYCQRLPLWDTLDAIAANAPGAPP